VSRIARAILKVGENERRKTMYPQAALIFSAFHSNSLNETIRSFAEFYQKLIQNRFAKDRGVRFIRDFINACMYLFIIYRYTARTVQSSKYY